MINPRHTFCCRRSLAELTKSLCQLANFSNQWCTEKEKKKRKPIKFFQFSLITYSSIIFFYCFLPSSLHLLLSLPHRQKICSTMFPVRELNNKKNCLSIILQHTYENEDKLQRNSWRKQKFLKQEVFCCSKVLLSSFSHLFLSSFSSSFLSFLLSFFPPFSPSFSLSSFISFFFLSFSLSFFFSSFLSFFFFPFLLSSFPSLPNPFVLSYLPYFLPSFLSSFLLLLPIMNQPIIPGIKRHSKAVYQKKETMKR